MNYQVIVGWGCRGIVILLTFLNTRLLLDVLGDQGFAAQSILVSMTSWFALFNLGLPMTVQNKISELRGSNKDRDAYIKDSLNVLIFQVVLTIPLFFIAALFVKSQLLNDFHFVDVSAVIIYCLSLFFLGQGQLCYQILYAENLAVYPNSYPAVVAVCNTLSLFWINYIGDKDFYTVVGLLACGNVIAVLHALLKCFKLCKFKVEFNIGKVVKSFSKSYQNWIFSIFSAMTLAVDYIAMSQVLVAKDIVAYNLTSRLFGLVLILYGVVLSTNWSPLSELTQSGRYIDARRAVHSLLRGGVLLAFIFGIAIVFFGNEFIKLWIGAVPDGVGLNLYFICFLYILIRIWTDTFSVALLGCGRVKLLNYYIPVQALLSFSLQCVFGKMFGVIGIYCGLIVSFLMTAFWILPLSFYRKKDSGFKL